MQVPRSKDRVVHPSSPDVNGPTFLQKALLSPRLPTEGFHIFKKNQHEDQDEVITLLRVLLQLKILIPQQTEGFKNGRQSSGQPPHNAENDMRSLGFLFHPFSLDGVLEKPGTWNYQQTQVNKQILEKPISRKHDLAKQNTFLFTESYASQNTKGNTGPSWNQCCRWRTDLPPNVSATR